MPKRPQDKTPTWTRKTIEKASNLSPKMGPRTVKNLPEESSKKDTKILWHSGVSWTLTWPQQGLSNHRQSGNKNQGSGFFLNWTLGEACASLGGVRGAEGGLKPSSPQDPPQLLRWHPQWGSTFALTVNSLWNSPLQLRSMTRPVMVGVYKRLNVCLSFRIKTNKND